MNKGSFQYGISQLRPEWIIFLDLASAALTNALNIDQQVDCNFSVHRPKHLIC